MADFLEEQINGLIRYGASWTDDYKVDITTTSSGQEDRFLVHEFPRRSFDVSYLLDKQATYDELVAIYHRAHGKYAGFRARCVDEWSSNGATGTPTAFDQAMSLYSTGVYDLRKYYGTAKTAGASGYPYRRIWKPVAGTVLVGIGATAIRSVDWTVDTTVGRVTFAADVVGTITSIGQSASAVLTVGTHVFTTGMSVYISGVNGMTQINGLRALITGTDATHITVAINSSAFSAYTGGGSVHTRPQTGEAVTAGFEFDFPVRFDTSLVAGQDYPALRSVDGVRLVELLKP